MAEEPICSVSNGSSISPKACSMRRSPLNFAPDAATPATTPSTCASILRVYVCPLTGIACAKSIFAVTSWSRRRTFAWSPPNSSRKLAWVPVVPFTPRKGSVAMR